MRLTKWVGNDLKRCELYNKKGKLVRVVYIVNPGKYIDTIRKKYEVYGAEIAYYKYKEITESEAER